MLAEGVKNDGALKAIQVTDDGKLKVDASVSVDAVTIGDIEIKNDAGNPVPVSGTVGLSNITFRPLGTVALSASSASGRVQLSATGARLRIRNYGPNRVFIALGNNAVSATTSGYPIEAYSVDDILRELPTETHLAAICANAGETASLSITAGN